MRLPLPLEQVARRPDLESVTMISNSSRRRALGPNLPKFWLSVCLMSHRWRYSHYLLRPASLYFRNAAAGAGGALFGKIRWTPKIGGILTGTPVLLHKSESTVIENTPRIS